MTLKIRFLEAVSSGELGEVDDSGVIVSLKQFKSYFEDVKSDYVNSFLPAAVIEAGQKSATQTKFLFRVRKVFIECMMMQWMCIILKNKLMMYKKP